MLNVLMLLDRKIWRIYGDNQIRQHFALIYKVAAKSVTGKLAVYTHTREPDDYEWV